MGIAVSAVSAVALVAVVDGQAAPLQAVVADEIAMGSLDAFHESINLIASSGGQQIIWDADTEGCDPGISAPLLTAAHSGYAIEIYEVSSRAHRHRRGRHYDQASTKPHHDYDHRRDLRSLHARRHKQNSATKSRR